VHEREITRERKGGRKGKRERERDRERERERERETSPTIRSRTSSTIISLTALPSTESSVSPILTCRETNVFCMFCFQSSPAIRMQADAEACNKRPYTSTLSLPPRCLYEHVYTHTHTHTYGASAVCAVPITLMHTHTNTNTHKHARHYFFGKCNSDSPRCNKSLLNIIKVPQQHEQCRKAELGKCNSYSSGQFWKTAPLFLLAHPWQCPRTAPVHTHTHTHMYDMQVCLYIIHRCAYTCIYIGLHEYIQCVYPMYRYTLCKGVHMYILHQFICVHVSVCV